MRDQYFQVKVITNEKDGCGNTVRPLTPGEVRAAIMNGLRDFDSVVVEEV